MALYKYGQYLTQTDDQAFDVDHSPAAVEALAVLAPVAGAAPVVDVEHGDAPAGPVLMAQIQRARA